ncbi:UDP-glycosyltransferase 83A1 [Vigna radiata var. radiata]|uniref:UDP-glycosyltransferase 83A1 n=1 Tax=Vigna radiata var. radiata TaxID=3916 RepID=A0A1S3UKG8_VIGRR|nr:UDP-glycosyltransferase 83A1 [Vigna radiata var. radiata]
MNIPNLLVVAFPVQGHVNPLMNFSQKMVEHGCKITFVNTDFSQKRMMSYVGNQESLEESPTIKLVSIPDGLEADDDRSDLGKLCDSVLSTMPSMLEKVIQDIHENSGERITCIVADVIMGWALEVGRKLGIKGILFCTASAATFALEYKIPELIQDGIIDSHGFPITKGRFQISPSMPSMDTKAIWWSNVYDPTTEKKIFKYLVHCMQNSNLAKWCICNTTYELEPSALSCVPKLLPVGPLLRNYDKTNVTARSLGQFWEEDHSCIDWLNQQPHCSVLYVAFGSFTLFDQNQFNELALGLDLTGRSFLWVVRQDNKMAFPSEFLGSKGKIVGWIPQLKVLNHPSIACFLSHCGWNSIIEGFSSGVPFLCWPYFTDQFHNRNYICDELKVGLGLNSDENGLVSRWEIKKKLDRLINDEQIRTRSLELKETVMNNIAEGGGSSENVSRLLSWLKS